MRRRTWSLGLAVVLISISSVWLFANQNQIQLLDRWHYSQGWMDARSLPRESLCEMVGYLEPGKELDRYVPDLVLGHYGCIFFAHETAAGSASRGTESPTIAAESIPDGSPSGSDCGAAEGSHGKSDRQMRVICDINCDKDGVPARFDFWLVRPKAPRVSSRAYVGGYNKVVLNRLRKIGAEMPCAVELNEDGSWPSAESRTTAD